MLASGGTRSSTSVLSWNARNFRGFVARMRIVPRSWIAEMTTPLTAASARACDACTPQRSLSRLTRGRRCSVVLR